MIWLAVGSRAQNAEQQQQEIYCMHFNFLHLFSASAVANNDCQLNNIKQQHVQKHGAHCRPTMWPFVRSEAL